MNHQTISSEASLKLSSLRRDLHAKLCATMRVGHTNMGEEQSTRTDARTEPRECGRTRARFVYKTERLSISESLFLFASAIVSTRPALGALPVRRGHPAPAGAPPEGEWGNAKGRGGTPRSPGRGGALAPAGRPRLAKNPRSSRGFFPRAVSGTEWSHGGTVKPPPPHSARRRSLSKLGHFRSSP